MTSNPARFMGRNGPPGDLSQLPPRVLSAGTTLFRATDHNAGPWYYASQGTGRFDLPAPKGTCYSAFDHVTCVLEQLFPEVLDARGLPLEPALLSGVHVYEFLTPAQLILADLQTTAAATYGASRELSTTSDYLVSQDWAAGLSVNFSGLAYAPRCNPQPTAVGVAVFGPAGADATWAPVASTTGDDLGALLRSGGLPVAGPPSLDEMVLA
ncbi:RES domain-containing protein [Peterkaempfera bronchialis]|uniref:RES domain-containing protein n=1 Tax=Peterkaempfera bronchialis TaxID=2126346 RepID=UPI0013B3AA1F|nr:RES domain-containing protein [Peterkaempfera bronchialis]